MAFDISKFDPNASGSLGAVKIGSYITSDDTLATVEANAYFDDIASAMKTSDLLYVEASDGTRWYKVTATASDVALTPIDDNLFTLHVTLDDITTGTRIMPVVIPADGTVIAARYAIGEDNTGVLTMTAAYNGTSIAAAAAVFATTGGALSSTAITGLSQAVTAGGTLSIQSDGTPSAGGAVSALFTIRRS